MTASRDRAKGHVTADVERVAYSVREFAAAVGVSMDSVYAAIHRKELAAFRFASEYRIPASEMARLLTEAQGRVSA